MDESKEFSDVEFEDSVGTKLFSVFAGEWLKLFVEL